MSTHAHARASAQAQSWAHAQAHAHGHGHAEQRDQRRPARALHPRTLALRTHSKGPALKGWFISNTLNRSSLNSENSLMRRLTSFITKGPQNTGVEGSRAGTTCGGVRVGWGVGGHSQHVHVCACSSKNTGCAQVMMKEACSTRCTALQQDSQSGRAGGWLTQAAASMCCLPPTHAPTYPGHGANVVLVAVRDDQRLNLVAPLVQEGRVGQDLLHAEVRVAAAWASACGVRVWVSECLRLVS